MKTCLMSCAYVFCFGVAIGQNRVEPKLEEAAKPNPAPAVVIERGPHHRVWERVEYEPAPGGKTTLRRHVYHELATGMHYQDDKGEWQESEAKIEVLPQNAGATAAKGQHKVIFPPDIYDGQIELNLPDGSWLRSRVLGLSYIDVESGKNVLIAELTNSVGEIHGDNVVIYPNAFTDFRADLRYTYTREGFEQDVVLREKIPLPEEFGLNPKTTRLQVLTEFFNPRVPSKTEDVVEAKTGGAIPDQTLSFGEMQMGIGKAFPQTSDSGETIPVGKQWQQLEGRDFLIEEVQVEDLLPFLDKLSKSDSASLETAPKTRRLASIDRQLPAKRRVVRQDQKKPNKTLRLAAAPQPRDGFVLDYVTLNTSLTNYTFKGDSTYYLSGSVNLYGTNTTFEGGAVIKYTNNVNLTVNTPVTWTGENYRPVVLVAKDDNSVGETIGGSTGNPGNSFYAANALSFNAATANTNLFLQNLRVANATRAVSINTKSGHVLQHVQFVKCAYGLSLTNAEVSLRNALMYQVRTNFTGSSSTGRVEHLTSHQTSRINANIGSNLFVTNSLLVLITNATSFTSVNNHTNLGAVGVFTNVVAGYHYLITGSTNRDVGTTNINGGLLADLKKMTTYPPLVVSNLTISGATNWSPQVQRDTDTPDLGYHYPAMDYSVCGITVSGGNLILTNGVVLASQGVASYSGASILIRMGGSVVSEGTPLNPNHICRVLAVQEQSVTWGFYPGYMLYLEASPLRVKARFTEFEGMSGTPYHLGGSGESQLEHCRMASGVLEVRVATSNAVKNVLFERNVINLSDPTAAAPLIFGNCLVKGGAVTLTNSYSGQVWDLRNNCFHDCSISVGSRVAVTNSYNAYINTTGTLGVTNSGDLFLSGFTYAAGPLGNFYHASTNFLNAGSAGADSVGLYHFTTQTNQVKETNSVVDIGYHYVALNASGQPFDFDGDGIPDYVEDKNGNGIVDPGEDGWSVVITNQPQSQSVSPGGSVTFTVGATGTPLYYRWLFNGTNAFANATNTSLTINPVSATNAGIYSVIVSNANGQVVSSNATLTVSCLSQPAGLAAWWQGEGNSDDSIGSNHGTELGGVNYTNGQVGMAFKFNGTDGRIDIPDTGALRPTNFTIEAWVYPLSLVSGWRTVYIKRQGENLHSIALYAQGGDSRPTLELNTGEAVAYGTGALATNQWSHLVGTYDGTNLILYVNGEAQNQPATVAISYTAEPAFIGGNDIFSGGEYFDGRIDEVSLYNRALSPSEIANLYLAGNIGKCPPPLGIIRQPENRRALAGDTVRLTVGAIGEVPLAYQWYRTGTGPISGATNVVLLLTNALTTASGNYWVIVTNVSGSVTSVTATVTVRDCDGNYPDGLVGWWRGEDNSNDSIGGNHGSLFHGNLEYADGAIGRAFKFDGDTKIGITNAPELEVTNFTLEAWVYPTTLPTSPTYSRTVALKAYNWDNLSYGLYAQDAGAYPAGRVNVAGNEVAATNNTSITLNTWTHLATTYDGAVVRLYVNGSLVNSQSQTGAITLNDSPFWIGGNEQWGEFFTGLIDEVSLYNRALSSNEIASIYGEGGLKCQGDDPTNQPPQITWVTPSNGQLFVISPTNILLQATNTGGPITAMLYYSGNTLIGSNTAPPYQVVWPDVTNGTYTLKAVGTNSAGGTSVAAYITNIVNAMPVITNNWLSRDWPLTNLVYEWANVTLTCTAWDPDRTNTTSGPVTNVQFFTWITNTLTPLPGTATVDNLQWSIVWSNRTAGYHSYLAEATDNRGAKSSSPLGVFRVIPTNPPPVVWLSNPTNNEVFRAGADITITAIAYGQTNSGGGPVTNVAFYSNGRLLGNDSASPYSVKVCCWEPGTYTNLAKASDSFGATKWSSNLVFVVGPKSPVSGEGFWDSTFKLPLVDQCMEYPPAVFARNGVPAIAVDRGDLYFPSLDYEGAQSFWKWNGTNWLHWFYWNELLYCEDMPVWGSGVSLQGTNVIVSGQISGGLSGVFQLEGMSWSMVGEGYQESSLDERDAGIVRSKVKHVGGDLYLFGNFDGIITNGTIDSSIKYLARWNVGSSRWESIGDQLNGPVWAVAEYYGHLVVGGLFTNASGNSDADHVAMLTGSVWQNLGTGVGGKSYETQTGAELEAGVFSLTVCSSNLFVGGDFSYAGGLTNAKGIAIWNGKSWESIAGGLEAVHYRYFGITNAIVYSVAVRGNELYVGGAFDSAVNPDNTQVSVANIAKAAWNENKQNWVWSEMDYGLYISPTEYYGEVLSLAIMEGESPAAYDVFAGGTFHNAGADAWPDPNEITDGLFWGIARWRVGYPSPPAIPSVTITNPTSFVVFSNIPTAITVEGLATSSYTNIVSLDLYTNGVYIQTLSGWSPTNQVVFAFDSVDFPKGMHNLKVVAIDDAGLKGQSRLVYFNVRDTNSPSLPSAASDQFTILMDSGTANLNVLANDLPATGLRVSQINDTGTTVAQIEPGHDGSYVSYLPPANLYGQDIFNYTVTNSANDLDITTVAVTIRAKPGVWISEPITGSKFRTNTPISITGAAWDWDGAATNVTLYVNGSPYTSTNPGPVGPITMRADTNNPTGTFTAIASPADNFSFNWTTNTAGYYSLVVAVICDHGITNFSKPVTIALTNLIVSPHLPVAAITSPTNAFSRTATVRDGFMTNLIGSAYDLDAPTEPVMYQLLLRDPVNPDGDPLFNVTPGPLNGLGFRDGAVTDGSLGTLDLTGVENGTYLLTLVVRGGSDEATDEVTISVGSDLKIGQFGFSQQDLVIPVNGIPLTLIRTYNSMNPRLGDFGYGWTYAINGMDIELNEERQSFPNNLPSIDGDDEDFLSNNTFSQRVGGSRDVTLTLPDGQRTTFTYYEASEYGSPTALVRYARWTNASPAVTATLEGRGPIKLYDFGTAGGEIPEALGRFIFWEGDSLGNNGFHVPYDSYDFVGWTLTTLDGTKYIIERENLGIHTSEYGSQGELVSPFSIHHWGKPRLTRIEQVNGDVLIINPDSVQHWDGGTNLTRQIKFERNDQGLITGVTDPAGMDTNGVPNGPLAMQYRYDSRQNLINVLQLVDRTNAVYVTNSFAYTNRKFPHYITSMIDARGITVARNEYDDDGRLTAVWDADGKVTRFYHNTTNRMEVITDRLGYTNTYVYDSRGNVRIHTNALNIVTIREYDDAGRETWVTNALGSTSETWSYHAYDQYGNATLVVNSGHTNRFIYDARGNLLSQIDPVGNITTNIYNSHNNLIFTAQLDPSGTKTNSQSSSFYSKGQLLYTYNANGQGVGTFHYSSKTGDMTDATDANGVTRFFGYDRNGNQTGSYYNWTNPASISDVRPVGSGSDYDAAGRVIKSTDQLGNSTRTYYNAGGKVDYSVDKFGNTNSFLYDTRGNLIQTTSADGLVTRTVYDDNGRAILTTDRNGSTGTETLYDPLGRVTNTVRRLNVQINIVSDAQYPALKRSEIGNLGTPISTNSTEYFESGWVKSRTAPNGAKTTYAYWPDGQTMYLTNVYATNVTFYKYDTAGRQEYVADALNRTNRFEYDGVGRMMKTIYQDGTFTTNIFNNLGQRVGVKDQADRLTQFAYDLSGQLTNVIKPDVLNGVTGANGTPQWAYSYDMYGRLHHTTDPLNQSTTNSYDEFGREVSRWLPMGGAGTTNLYNQYGQITNRVDFKGQRQTFKYDRFGRVTNTYFFAAGPTITYPSNSVAYIYNHLGQLTNITERWGTDASSSYVAAVGMPGGKAGRYAALMAFVNRIPAGVQGGFLGVMFCGVMAMMLLAAEARRCRVSTWEFAQTLLTTVRASTFLVFAQRAGRGEVASSETHFRSLPSAIFRLPLSLVMLCSYAAFVLRCGGTPDGTPRRFRLPSYGWRLATIITLIAVIGSDPHFDGLWTARAACGDVPSTIALTDTIRSTNFTYDLEGRLTQVNSPEGYINYEYDLATGRHTSTCTAKSKIEYGYDDLGRLQTVHVLKRNGSPVDETTTYTYTAVGSRQTVSLPNGVVTTWQYDELNRLTNVANVKTSGNELLSQFSYKLDLSGRRTNAVEIIKQESGSPTYQTNAMSWQYDGMYRLTNEVCVAMVTSASYTNRFQYDLNGNRWSQERINNTGTTTITNQYNANDQLLKEVTLAGGVTTATNLYSYDANGSLIAKTNMVTGGSTNLYSYDLKNKLSQVASFKGSWVTNSFIYNEQGIRVRTLPTSGNPILYLVDGNNHTGYGQVLEEFEVIGGAPTLQQSYVIGDDVLAQGVSSASYLLYDGHGSTRQLSSSIASVTSRYNYDAYGTRLDSSTSVANEILQSSFTSLLYCGEQYDSTLNMYNLRARFYDPIDGRFNARDTFAGSNSDPQSLHKYTYANCDPVNGADPTGLFNVTELMVIITTLSAVSSLLAVAYSNQKLRAKNRILQVYNKDPLQYEIERGRINTSADFLGVSEDEQKAIFDYWNEKGDWEKRIELAIEGNKILKANSAHAISTFSDIAGLGLTGVAGIISEGEAAANIVYRVLRSDEIPELGLFPKAPSANYSLEGFIINGSREGFASQYIATTRDLKVAKYWAIKDNCRVVAIDLNKLDYRAINDFSTRTMRNTWLRGDTAKAFSASSSEVVIEGSIPAKAILPYIPFE